MSELTQDQKLTNLETLLHIRRVQAYLNRVVKDLIRRVDDHDSSKLESPEVELFTEFTPKLSGSTYGSEEYNEFRRLMKPALDHHYANNRHHPEHWPWRCPVCELRVTEENYEYAPQGPNDSGKRYCPRCCQQGMLYESELIHDPDSGVNGMTLMDLIEMLVDWKAASERHTNGNILNSLKINKDRFHLSPQLVQILYNTIGYLWEIR